MKALIRYDQEPGSLRIEDINIPEVKTGQVRIKVSHVGICGRDLEHNAEKLPANKVPFLPGHEFSGVIESVSPEFQDKFKIGDRVTAETVVYVCETCPECVSGNYNLCSKRKNVGSGMIGAFAELISVPGKYIHKIPEGMSLEEAAVVEPCAVSYNAVIKNSNVNENDFVVIIGAGAIGLLCLQFAKFKGAKVCVLGHESDIERLKIAKNLGADFTMFSNSSAPAEISKISNGKVDLVIDTVGGVDATMNLAIDIVKPLGQITKVGWFMKTSNIDFDKLVRKSIKLQGSFSHNYEIWEAVIDMIRNKKIDAKEIIGHVMPLDDWKKAFDILYSKSAVKILLTPNSR